MDYSGFEARCLSHTVCRSSGRRAEQEFDALSSTNAQNGMHDAGFTDTESSVMTITFDIMERRIAAAWLSARVRLVFFSIQGRAFSASIVGHGSALANE